MPSDLEVFRYRSREQDVVSLLPRFDSKFSYAMLGFRRSESEWLKYCMEIEGNLRKMELRGCRGFGMVYDIGQVVSMV